MDTIRDWDVENTTTFAFCMSKCAVSDSQQVVIIYGGTAKLARAKPGDEAWTKVNNTEHSSFWDVVCHRDQFYAINGDAEIFAIDGDVARSASALLPDGLRRQKQECLYLVGSEDSDRKLWVVSREGVDLRPVHPGNEDVLHYGTYGFQVFEVYLGTKRWKEIENLANRSIFLGHNSSLSLDVSSNPRCKTNCIYFTDDYGEGYWYMHEEEHTEFGGKDMGIYNLQDGTVEPLYKGQYSYHPINFAKTSEVLAVVKLQERLISACLL